MSLADPMRRAALAVLAGAVLAGAALLPAAALAQTPAPIRIGLIAPLSGGSADCGTSVRNATAASRTSPPNSPGATSHRSTSAASTWAYAI